MSPLTPHDMADIPYRCSDSAIKRPWTHNGSKIGVDSVDHLVNSVAGCFGRRDSHFGVAAKQRANFKPRPTGWLASLRPRRTTARVTITAFVRIVTAWWHRMLEIGARK